MAIVSSVSIRISDFAELVKFSHTIFLFPFALAAVFMAQRVRPLTWPMMLWIVVALVAARSAAMVMNRIADRKIDAVNPRTAQRPLVTGRVSMPLAWAWLATACGLFVLAAWQLGPLPLALSPIALAWVLGYSFTKRFTALCHIWLGMATALAPLGAWIAVAGTFTVGAVVLALSVSLWVAGFDIIYACQDVDFDRAHGLNSIPARLGISGALWLSSALHGLALAGLAALGPLMGLGAIYLVTVLVLGFILATEQIVVRRRLANVPMAFFTMNGVFSMLYLLGVALDIWIGGGGLA